MLEGTGRVRPGCRLPPVSGLSMFAAETARKTRQAGEGEGEGGGEGENELRGRTCPRDSRSRPTPTPALLAV